MTRWIVALLSALLLLILGMGAYGYREARADPVVRVGRIALADWPAGSAPIRAALLSDIHLGGAAMDADRLTRIVDRVVRLRPDIVLIAGDFASGHDPVPARRVVPALSPAFRRLKPRLGIVAVLGNHDHWSDASAVREALIRGGVTLLSNQAIERGPIRIAGVDDEFTGHDRAAATLAAARTLPGALVTLSHAPDIAAALPRGGVLLAGHTHCGQIVLPGIGPLDQLLRRGRPPLYDPRYRCGIAHVEGRTVVVGAGLGTSVLPIRIGAPPDLWLLTLGPAPAR